MSEPDWSQAGLRATLLAALQPLGYAEADVDPKLSLSDDLGLDSFQLMQVARHLETAYAFRFSLADWALIEDDREDQAYTIASLLDFLAAHRPGGET